MKVSIVGSLRDREVACSASDRQGSNFESCVWRTVSSQSSHHPQGVLLAKFSLYVHKGSLKPDSFHCRLFCVEKLDSYSIKWSLPKYWRTGIQCYCSIYIITVLIKTSAKFESHYSLLAVSHYLDHFFSASFNFQELAFETVCWSYCLLIFTLFQTVQRHGVYIAAYDMQLLLLLLL